MRNEFIAVYELDDSRPEPRYFAYCPEMPGARAEGKTMDEARATLAEAIRQSLQRQREKTMREILYDLPPEATSEIIAIRETVDMRPGPPLLC